MTRMCSVRGPGLPGQGPGQADRRGPNDLAALEITEQATDQPEEIPSHTNVSGHSALHLRHIHTVDAKASSSSLRRPTTSPEKARLGGTAGTECELPRCWLSYACNSAWTTMHASSNVTLTPIRTICIESSGMQRLMRVQMPSKYGNVFMNLPEWCVENAP